MFLFLQASSDLSILDFDIPFSIFFIVAGGIEMLTTIGIMASVTWQVLIVAIMAMVAAKYVQVDSNFSFFLLFSLSFSTNGIMELTVMFCSRAII